MSAVAVAILLFLACAGLVAVVAAVRAPAGRGPGAADGGDEAGGGDGGNQPRVPPTLPPDPSGMQESPAWWPAFERDLAAYVRRREQAGAGAE
jgi:hypothetical protein